MRDWILWRIVLRSPSGLPITVENNAPSQDQAVLTVLRRYPEHVLAKDEHGVPLVTQRPKAA